MVTGGLFFQVALDVSILLVVRHHLPCVDSFTPKRNHYQIKPFPFQRIFVQGQQSFSKTYFSAVGSISDEENENQRYKRRNKKNKYEKFSQIKSDVDPFDQLLAETNQKLQAMQEAKERRKLLARPKALQNLKPPPKINFPDTKEINPYDPTTFGYTEIGHVTGAHGVHGWLKVKSTTDFSIERLCTTGIRHLKPARKRAPRQVTLVQGIHRVEDEYLVQLEHVTNREEALLLRGSTLYVRQEDKVLPTTKHQRHPDDEEDGDDNTISTSISCREPDEYLVSDLVGLEVHKASSTGHQAFVGLVNGVVLAEDMCSIPGLGQDLLEVVLQEGPLPSFRDKLVLIPLVPQIVPTVDISNGFVVIDPPKGLLDLTYVKSERVRIKGFLPYTKEEGEEDDYRGNDAEES